MNIKKRHFCCKAFRPTLFGGLLVVFLLILTGCEKPPAPTETQVNKNTFVKKQNQNQTVSEVPLPSEISIIHTFFELINEQRVADAINMMAPDTVGDESQKQAWGVQFNAFRKMSAEKIEQSIPESWTDTNHSYKVTLEVQMKPEAAKAPIPNYGYDNGTNIRWVTLEKVGDFWKINGIATGP